MYSLRRSAAVVALVLAGSTSNVRVDAQSYVTGVEDEEFYSGAVSFSVLSEAGFDYTVTLNDVEVPTDTLIEVDRADYYELRVERRPQSGGAAQVDLIQFIVRASGRGSSESGLPPFVPLPEIPSAAAEFAGGSLELVAPSHYPVGMPIPVVAWVRDGDGERLGVNGPVEADGFPSLRLLRGVGSMLLPAEAGARTLDYAAQAGPLSASRTISVEEPDGWTAVSGSTGSSADWGEDAWIRVTGKVSVPAGSSLTVGAGTVVALSAGVSIEVAGELIVDGTAERPVVFAPAIAGAPWGGLLFRNASSRGTISRSIFTGSGANPNWFDEMSGVGSSHRHEEPLLYVSNGARVVVQSSYIIDNAGQGGHGEGGFLTMTDSLIQRCITAGQYNGGTIRLTRCALLEFPGADAPFEDEDNDALYMTGGAHYLDRCLVGWALDDGMDAGSGSGGPVDVTNCWVESCYHEAMAWSESRAATVLDSVTINCGQGIECGFGDPDVVADRCLSTANLIGTRFGDNYDWDYGGNLEVRNSLLLYNLVRDVWGRAWDNWNVHLSQMDIHDNLLTLPDEEAAPDNALWQPESDASRLEPFLPTPATEVGIGVATREDELGWSFLPDGLPVGLSSFTTHEVSVEFSLGSTGGLNESGVLRFPPGQTVEFIDLEAFSPARGDEVTVILHDPTGGELTGRVEVTVVDDRPIGIIPFGSEWAYSDTGTNLGTAWKNLEYDDSSWKRGRAELGYGDGDEATVINGGPSGSRYPTTYFRRVFEVADPGIFDSLRGQLRRDDGAIVYINGVEVFRSNMPAGTVTYSTYTGNTADPEDAFHDFSAGPDVLRPGTNVIAVEVHQANATSSDVSFELKLVGTPSRNVEPPGSFLRGDANRDGRLDIGDPVTVLFFLYLGEPSSCQDALDADDTGLVEMADAVFLLEYLFLSGPPIAEPFPLRGLDPTPDGLDCDGV